MKVQHEDPDNYKANKVTVRYDNKQFNLPVEENGVVQVETDKQLEGLVEKHGSFEVVEGSEEDLVDYVLEDKTVDEVEKYVRDIENKERLKELRVKESENKDRKSAKQVIDERLKKLNRRDEQVVDAEFEEVNEQKQEQEENNDEVEE